jgi:hypothetical protein
MKTLIAFLLSIATCTPAMSQDSDLVARLQQHVRAIASREHNTAKPEALEQSARYIEAALAAEGYPVRRQEYTWDGQRVRNLEVSLSNPGQARGPDRIIIVGAHYDSAPGSPGANDNGSGAAALLELARILKTVTPRKGTELKLVFFVNEEPPHFMTEGMGSWRHAKDLHERGQNVEAALILETIGYYTNARNSQRYPFGLAPFYPNAGNFIGFVGTLGSSGLVRKTLDAFRAASRFHAEGLAAPGFIEGVTWSDHTSYNRFGYQALMITDTAHLRYPHYHTAQDTPDKLDYPSIAHIVEGMARVIEGMTAVAP